MAVQRQDGWANDSGEVLTGHDLRGKEHRFCTRTSAGYIRLAQAGEYVSGVIQEGANAGYAASFATSGHPLKVIAGAAITAGQAVMSGGDGTVVPGTTNQVGVARNSCNSGEMCEVMIDRIT